LVHVKRLRRLQKQRFSHTHGDLYEQGEIVKEFYNCSKVTFTVVRSWN